MRRGEAHDRLATSLAAGDHDKAARDVDREIAKLEDLRETIVRDGLPEDRVNESRDYSGSFGGGSRGDDHSWGR